MMFLILFQNKVSLQYFLGYMCNGYIIDFLILTVIQYI